MNKKIEVYTDGACSGNPGPGGWGVVLLFESNKRELSGYEDMTTNNRMELHAAIAAMDVLKESCDVNLYSDSAYLCNAFNQGWLDNWQSNGWKTSKKTLVQNIDLWEKLLELGKTHDVKYIKVKGHSDNEWNNRCDFLATNQIKINVNNKRT